MKAPLLLTSIFMAGSLMTAHAQWDALGATPSGISSSWASFQHIAKDASGNLYTSFYDGSVTQGSVMKYNGSSWSYLGGAGITGGSATYNGLAVAANGDVFYSNQVGWPGSGIAVRKFNGTTWDLLPSAESATVNFQSLATRSNNQPVVAYSSGGALQVKRYDGSNWTSLGTGLPAGTPNYIDLKIVNDTAYVAFVNSGLKVYKTYAGSGATSTWQEVGTTSFAAASSEQYRAALAVDANNNVFVAFTSVTASGNKINVKKYSNNQWTDVGASNFSTDRVHYVSIALSATGEPYVAYSHFENSPNNKNYVMKFDGNTWIQLGTTVSDGEAKWNALLIGNDNKPVLAYSDGAFATGGNMVKKFSGTISNCYLPANLSLSNVTTTAASIDWTLTPGGSAAFNYIYELRTTGNPGSGTSGLVDNGTTTSTNKTWTNLSAGTAYTFYVRTNCSTDTSNWVNLPFSTYLYQPVSLQGFNYDVIANGSAGSNPALASTTNAVDDALSSGQGGFAYLSDNYGGGAYPTGLPANRLLASGVKRFILADYDSVNVLKLSALNEKDTLTFAQPLSAKSLHLLTVSGSGATTGSFKVIFTDGSNSLFSNITINDWYGSNAYRLTRRVDRASGIVDAAAGNGPNFYETSFTLTAADTLKQIRAIEVTKTDASAYLNVFAVSIVPSATVIVQPISLAVHTQNNVAAAISTNAGTLPMVATFTPLNTTNTGVSWTIVPVSGNADISAGGVVTAIANGTVYAKAVSVQNPALKDSMMITISNQTIPVSALEVRTVNNIPAEIMTAGGQLPVHAAILPANASNQNVSWSIVPASGTASINPGGIVTAITDGIVYAKAVSVADPTIMDSLMITIGDQSVSISERNDNILFSVFPSPFRDKLSIDLPQFTQTDRVSVTVYNILGQAVYTGKITNTLTNLYLAHLNPGIYQIRVTHDRGSRTIKVIKE